jgi:DNA topoisomerase VI subunit B
MANRFTLKIDSISTDGTNLYFEVSVSNGAMTLPPIRPSFPVAVSKTTVDTFMQTIVDNGETIPVAMVPLVGKVYKGA